MTQKSTSTHQQQGTDGGRKTQIFGLPAEALGAAIGAVVGSAATALLKTPKGQSLNMTDGLKAGALTAGALAVGQMGLVASEAVENAANAVKNAQTTANEWLAQSKASDEMSEPARMAVEEEETLGQVISLGALKCSCSAKMPPFHVSARATVSCGPANRTCSTEHTFRGR